MKNRIIKLFKELTTISKIALIAWFIYSMTSLTTLSIPQWILVYWVGCLIFILPIQLLTKNRKRASFTNIDFKSKVSDEPDTDTDTDTIITQEVGFQSPKNKLAVDPYFKEAGKLVIEKEKASIGMIQRAFKIGFNRASKIMDQLGSVNVVGPENGTAPRRVLMTNEEFQNLTNIFDIEYEDLNEYNVQANNNGNFSENANHIHERVLMYNNKFDYMEGHDFEEYCAVLLKNIGYQNVEVTKGSNDNGIDILATLGGVKYGIQCKCYSSDIGVKAIQEAYAGAKYYNCHVPVVLTNQYFTRQAQELADRTNVLLWDRSHLIVLVDALESE